MLLPASNLFENMIAEIVARTNETYSELSLRRCLQNSYMLSSDVNAAYDPLNAGLYDKDVRFLTIKTNCFEILLCHILAKNRFARKSAAPKSFCICCIAVTLCGKHCFA